MNLLCAFAGANRGRPERSHDRWVPRWCACCVQCVLDSLKADLCCRSCPAGFHCLSQARQRASCILPAEASGHSRQWTCRPADLLSLQSPAWRLSHLAVPLAAEDWHSAVIFGLSVAAALSPQMMPMMLTANLARGTAQMRKNQAVVRRLDAVQNMGAM